MRRRISSAAVVVSASALLTAGGGIAFAAPGKSKAAKPKVTVSTLKCVVSLATEPPPGSADVPQPSSSGSQFGRIHCPTAGFGSGMAGDTFTVPDSGDTVGTYTEYFATGSIRGKFDLVPQESAPPTTTSFASESLKGTVTVTGGTGTLKGLKSPRSGTMSCTSSDTVHMTCTEKVRVRM